MRILLTGPVSLKFKEKLKTLGEVDYNEVDETKLREIIGNYEVIVLRSRTRVAAETIKKAKKLKIIARYGKGLDNIDVKAAEKAGIKVINAPTASVSSVAEHTIMLMLAAMRQLPTAAMSIVRGRWDKDAIMGMELAGKTVGLLGYGKIGRATAGRLRAFGCKIIFYDKEYYDYGRVELDEVFKQSDVVSIHLPLDKDTYHLVNDEKLSMMKDGSFLINTARGAILDMAALEKHANRLGGIGIDVFEEEPPRIKPFMMKTNMILTPHISANTAEARRRVGEELFDRLKEMLGR